MAQIVQSHLKKLVSTCDLQQGLQHGHKISLVWLSLMDRKWTQNQSCLVVTQVISWQNSLCRKVPITKTIWWISFSSRMGVGFMVWTRILSNVSISKLKAKIFRITQVRVNIKRVKYILSLQRPSFLLSRQAVFQQIKMITASSFALSSRMGPFQGINYASSCTYLPRPTPYLTQFTSAAFGCQHIDKISNLIWLITSIMF